MSIGFLPFLGRLSKVGTPLAYYMYTCRRITSMEGYMEALTTREWRREPAGRGAMGSAKELEREMKEDAS